MEFSINRDFGDKADNVISKNTAERLDDKEEEDDPEDNEIEGIGDDDHMKESQEEAEEEEHTDMGPGGLAGLIANLSGVIIILQLNVIVFDIHSYSI